MMNNMHDSIVVAVVATVIIIVVLLFMQIQMMSGILSGGYYNASETFAHRKKAHQSFDSSNECNDVWLW